MGCNRVGCPWLLLGPLLHPARLEVWLSLCPSLSAATFRELRTQITPPGGHGDAPLWEKRPISWVTQHRVNLNTGAPQHCGHPTFQWCYTGRFLWGLAATSPQRRAFCPLCEYSYWPHRGYSDMWMFPGEASKLSGLWAWWAVSEVLPAPRCYFCLIAVLISDFHTNYTTVIQTDSTVIKT